MGRRTFFLVFGIFAAMCVAFLFGMVSYYLGADDDSWSFGGNVGLITVEGTIISADETIEDIEKFRKNDDIKSVILRIESPGGSVGASQEILESVRMLAKEKPVIASMGSIAASGGYYIACGATKILANEGSVTGSIGVRMEHMMVGDLLKWAKVQSETLKSGKFKDIASSTRPMTPEERRIMQDVLDDIHAQFKESVAFARNLPMEKVNEIADGRVYTGRQALKLGLVDEIGGFGEALKIAARMGGITGEPRIKRPGKHHRLIDRILDSADSIFGSSSSALFLGHWQPMMMH